MSRGPGKRKTVVAERLVRLMASVPKRERKLVVEYAYSVAWKEPDPEGEEPVDGCQLPLEL